jgi:outer membrane receptor for ferrienterochelin and colicins
MADRADVVRLIPSSLQPRVSLPSVGNDEVEGMRRIYKSTRTFPCMRRVARAAQRGVASLAASCLLATFATGHALADPDSVEVTPTQEIDSDEEVVFQDIPSVYGVSKFEQKITEAPSFVTVISSDELRLSGARTLADALRGVTGFFVTYDRNYNYLGVRGFNRPGDFNTRVLLLVDGHRLNDSLYDQAGLGTESLIDVDLIHQIEVIRGPSSSLYGTNAFFGVINVITKQGRDVRGAEVSAAVGSFRSSRVGLTYGDKLANGAELLLSGSFYDSEGQDRLFYPEFDDPATGNGIVRDADGDRFPNLFGKASFRGLTLQGGFVSREKEIPTAAYGTVFPTDRTRSTDEHGYVFLKFERDLSTKTNVSGRVYYDRFYYRGDYLYDVAMAPPPSLVLNRDRSTGEWWGTEAKVNQQLLESHNVTAGLEYRDNFRQDLLNEDVDPPATYLDDRRDSWYAAAFLQDEIFLTESLILNAGLRYDYYDSFGSTLNPRVALIYNIGKTTIKALYGTAFRGANAYERFYVGTGFKANPNLDPETITTYELALEQSLTAYLRATGSIYDYSIDDLVSQETDPGDGLLVFRNGGEIGARGLELQLELDERGPLGVGGKLGYALQGAKDRRTGRSLTNSPRHLVNLSAVVPMLGDRLTSVLETQYVSRRRTLSGDQTGDYIVANLVLSARILLPGLEVSLSVRNLFDREYSDPGSGEQVQDEIEQDGRTFWLKAKYAF